MNQRQKMSESNMLFSQDESEKLKDWKALNLQIILFTTESYLNKEQKWWNDLLDCSPHESLKRMDVRVDAGPAKGLNAVNLTLKIEVDRITWILTPIGDVLGSDPSAPSILAIEDVMHSEEWFVDKFKKWLSFDSIPVVKRISFACSLVKKAADIQGAYQLAREHLKNSVVVDQDSSDLLYRINRKRKLVIGGESVDINRVSTWACTKFELMRGQISSAGFQPLNTSEKPVAACYLAIDMDINTPFDRTLPIEKENLYSAVVELVKNANEIAISGDVK